MPESDIREKYAELKSQIAKMGKAAVAFSAGVDSTLLLAAAHEALGDDVVAFTAISPANPRREVDEAVRFCEQRGIRHIAFEVDELQIPGFEQNPPERCYICKRHLFGEMKRRAGELGIGHLLEGSNATDQDDYRPGARALGELGVESPLLACGLTKDDIRALLRHLGLPAAEKPSFACLYTRFAYGDTITPQKLQRVGSAEQWLHDQGFATVRVRLADAVGDTARIELSPDDIARAAAPGMRERLVEALKRAGFSYVALDLQGYRTGSMNETL